MENFIYWNDDFVMNSPNDTITLIWTGSQWLEVSRSDNA